MGVHKPWGCINLGPARTTPISHKQSTNQNKYIPKVIFNYHYLPDFRIILSVHVYFRQEKRAQRSGDRPVRCHAKGWWSKKFVPSLESLSSLGFEGRNLGCPGNFAGMSRTPQGVEKCEVVYFLAYQKGTLPLPQDLYNSLLLFVSLCCVVSFI